LNYFFFDSDRNRIKYLNGKAFRAFKYTSVHMDINVCVNASYFITFGGSYLSNITKKCGFVEPKLKVKTKPPKKSKQSLIMIILTVCAILFCVLVGLILYRKFYDERSSARKLADLTISSTIITDIQPWPVENDDPILSLFDDTD
jgi:hypothetical protein